MPHFIRFNQDLKRTSKYMYLIYLYLVIKSEKFVPGNSGKKTSPKPK